MLSGSTNKDTRTSIFEDIYTFAKSNCSCLDKVAFIRPISPLGDNNISKKENICIKDALFPVYLQNRHETVILQMLFHTFGSFYFVVSTFH